MNRAPSLRGRCAALLLLLLVASLPARAAQPADEVAQRHHIRDERVAANALFARREQECRTRFVVSSCIDEARRDLRETLARIQARESTLDDAQRKRRAAERLERVEANQREAAQRALEDAAKPPRELKTRRLPQPHVTVRPPKPRAEAPSQPRERPAVSPASGASQTTGGAFERRDDEARKKAAFEARQQDAQAHRDAVERRNVERAIGAKKIAAPLPIPPASSAAPR